MYVYSCAPDWESMLTCIFDAWASKKGHSNIKLLLEPIEQYELFNEYIHVDADPLKAKSVMDAVNEKISTDFYRELAYAAMAYEPDVLDVIYHVMILGFAYGPNVLEMKQYADIMRFFEIRRRIGNESHSFREFVRFHEISKAMYVAHIEPKSRIVVALGNCFSDRMPSENWMIIDDIHRECIVHPCNEEFYYRKLDEEEYEKLLDTERENDEYTDLWRVFFDSIAIKERENYRCQRNFFPKWKRKHVVEFN